MLSLKEKTNKVIEWAKGWDGFNGYLKLNALIASDGEATIVTDATDNVLTEYINGDAIRQYYFNLRMVMPWSSGFDQTNQDSMAVAVQLYDWVEEQNATGNYPDWGDDALITEIANTQSQPQVNFIYEEDGLAEYLIACRIEYEE